MYLSKIESILNVTDITYDKNGIYVAFFKENNLQNDEILLRKKVAEKTYPCYLSAVAKSHSIPVMDKEIIRFLKHIPTNGIILDIGGCWGWHWRKLASLRPDINVILLDFIYNNLLHAKNLLGTLIGTQVFLIHCDATKLPWGDIDEKFCGFDAIWSVQALQHIPNFYGVCLEINRVLKNGGIFINYSLHNTPLNKFIYSFVNKKFHSLGDVSGAYHLTRANDNQRKILSEIFSSKISERYTECLFHPDLKLSFTGKNGSILGSIDKYLSSNSSIAKLIARQRSFEIHKNISL